MKYRSNYRSRRTGRSGSDSGVWGYLMPFLILVCIGVIAVLIFNLWKAIYGEDEDFSAYMHFVDGSAKIKPFGTDSFVSWNSDTRLAIGDEVVTSPDARIIVEFFDGTIMRLDGETNVLFEEIDGESRNPFLKLLLVDGKIWFNKSANNAGGTDINVATENLLIKSEGDNIFAVDNNFDESVRVLDGDDIEVDVLAEDGKPVETVSIAVGQEVVFTEDILDRFWQFQSPNALQAISDVFRRSEWYTWNANEDESPTKFRKSDGESVVDESLIESDPEELNTSSSFDDSVTFEESVSFTDSKTTDPSEEDEEDVTTISSAPTVSAVSGVTKVNADGFYVVTSTTATLQGAVPEGTESVMVNGYTLQQFKAGDSQWKYLANSDYGLMKEGENVYDVYAVGADGKKSPVLKVKVFYKAAPKPAPTPTPTPTPGPTTSTTTPPSTSTTTEPTAPTTDGAAATNDI